MSAAPPSVRRAAATPALRSHPRLNRCSSSCGAGALAHDCNCETLYDALRVAVRAGRETRFRVYKEATGIRPDSRKIKGDNESEREGCFRVFREALGFRPGPCKGMIEWQLAGRLARQRCAPPARRPILRSCGTWRRAGATATCRRQTARAPPRRRARHQRCRLLLILHLPTVSPCG